MELIVDPAHLAAALAAILSALAAIAIGLGRLLVRQFTRGLDDRFAARDAARDAAAQVWQTQLSSLERAIQDEAREWQRNEREILLMKADLPVNYVRREDYIRNQSVIEAKIDGLALKIESALLRDRP